MWSAKLQGEDGIGHSIQNTYLKNSLDKLHLIIHFKTLHQKHNLFSLIDNFSPHLKEINLLTECTQLKAQKH